MRPVLCLAFISAIAASPACAAGDPEASFLGETVYATVADCSKAKKAGTGPRSAASVPTTLTAKGYVGFDSGCRFVNIDERYKGRIWTVSLSCSEGRAETTLRTEVWRRLADGSLSVTVNKTSTTFVACSVDKPSATKKQ